MNIKHLLSFLIVVSGLAACSSGTNKFTIIGNITGLPEQTVILEQLNFNDIISVVDSIHSNKDGHFELSGIAPEPGIYRLHFTTNRFILLSIDKGNINIKSNWNTLEAYTVAGSQASENLKNFLGAIREYRCDMNTMFIVFDSLKARGNDSIMANATRDFQDMNQHFTTYVENFADTTPYEPNAIFAAMMLKPGKEGIFLGSFTQSLGKRFPTAKMTKDFAEYNMKAAAMQKQGGSPNSISAEIGAQAPEVSLPDADGKIVTLSSFRGKYVLLDFWASWCHPCREDNPYVVAAFEKFKDKNFTILGVSLDDNKEEWQKAIKSDKLIWTQITDLKKWSCAGAQAYNINSIPTNYLIDPRGNIIAKNLHGTDIEKRLEELIKTGHQ